MVRTSALQGADQALLTGFLLLLLTLMLATLTLAGCGRREDEAPAVSPPAPPPQAGVSLPPVSRAEKAAFAFERLTRGPLPRTSRFEIPSLQLLNLQHAKRDLVTLSEETFDLLRDETLRAEIQRIQPSGEGRPSWHSVLDLLLALPEHPVDLALAWTDGMERALDAPSQRRAVDVLAATRDVRAAPRLLALLRIRARDREVGRTATAALLAFGEPWGQRALDVIYRYGGSRTWGRVPLLISAAAASDDSEASEDLDADALAWWALLAETGSPVPSTDLNRVVRPAWAGLVLRLVDGVWPREPAGLGLAQRFGRLVAPAWVLEANGGIPQRRDLVGLVPPRGVEPGGKKSAAQARALLAEAGFQTYVHAVKGDLDAPDQTLADIAAASSVGGSHEGAADMYEAIVEQYIDGLDSLYQPDPTAVAAALQRLGESRPEVAAKHAWTVLERARPWGRHEVPLKIAYELLAERDGDRLLETVSRLVRSADPAEGAVALALIRWVRDARYVPVVLGGLSALPLDAQALHRRLLVWLQTSPDAGMTDEDAVAFVGRYAAWIDDTLDADAIGLVTGLLDLGKAGASAFAEGLRGPRRRVYVAGLLSRPGVVPSELAEALLAPLDQDTPIPERYAVWVATYRSAPTEAAPYLAAARARLAPADRAETDDILEALRHRAPAGD